MIHISRTVSLTRVGLPKRRRASSGSMRQVCVKCKRMLTAITRAVSPSMEACELTYLERQSIDIARAREQHRAYEACLAELGVEVISLAAEADYPDAVFVEDAAVVLDEVAVMTRTGAASRRGEA